MWVRLFNEFTTGSSVLHRNEATWNFFFVFLFTALSVFVCLSTIPFAEYLSVLQVSLLYHVPLFNKTSVTQTVEVDKVSSFLFRLVRTNFQKNFV